MSEFAAILSAFGLLDLLQKFFAAILVITALVYFVRKLT